MTDGHQGWRVCHPLATQRQKEVTALLTLSPDVAGAVRINGVVAHSQTYDLYKTRALSEVFGLGWNEYVDIVATRVWNICYRPDSSYSVQVVSLG